jgi:hypothetical protein
MDYQTGDILICSGKSTLSKTIMNATKSNFSHTAQIIILNGIPYVFDAQKNGVCLRTIGYWKHTYQYEIITFRPTRLIENYEQFMLGFAGVPYDKKGLIVGLFKSLLINLFKRKDMNDKFRNNGLFWCSELTMKPYVENPEDYTPQKVFDYCVQQNFEKIN